MTSSGPSTAPAGAGGPKPLPQQAQHSEAVKEKKDLASWWKNFKRSDKKGQDQVAPQGIFGVPLQTSIRYANVAISLFNDEGQSYIYGYVPIVVAKCGVFLKEKATDVEGIFRLAGSEKRIKELKVAFDSPDRYGKGLDWTGYTVHDAANILRRYFNQLPEPIIPLEFYQRFRDPLRNHQAQAVGAIEAQSPSEGEFNVAAAIRAYQNLITELPPLNRQLLLYILDLLAVFASKSDLNKMTTHNLAAIFQPGILNHPQHDMAPQEYRLSQDVLIFLIENQDSFLIGMQGTAADPETVRDVQSGTPAKHPSSPTTPNRSKTVIGRSGSSSSVAAESVRKWGSIRRNVSVSSKHSKHSQRSEKVVQPSSPAPATPTGGVHRSNTVPSRRGGSTTQSPRFSQNKHSDPSTPNPPNSSGGATIAPPGVVETIVVRSSTSDSPSSIQNTPTAPSAPVFPAAPEVKSASSSEATTPLASMTSMGSETSSAVAREYRTPKKDTIPLLSPGGNHERSGERSVSNTPSTTSGRKGFLDILKQSPTSDGESRKPNKLQKKRGIPGSALSSAQSSNHSLHEDQHEAQRSPASPKFAAAPPLVAPAPVTAPAPAPAVAQGPAAAAAVAAIEKKGDAEEHSAYATAENTPTAETTPYRYPTENTLRPTVSPSHSFQSHTDTSDADMVGDDMPEQTDEAPKEKKRHRWRFSRTQNKLEQPSTPGNPFGTSSGEHMTSKSTIGSGGSQPRKSFQEPTPLGSVSTDPVVVGGPQHSATSDTVFSDSERERRGPVSWLKNKLQERKDEKRSHTPERGHERSKSRQDVQLPVNDAPAVRGKSFEQPRNEATAAAQAAAQQSVAGQSMAGSTGDAAVRAAQTANTNGERHSENIEPKTETTTQT